MANKKYQVFISSTFKDLIEERQLILKVILDLDHIPSGMELFPAADEDQFEYIKQVIDECDYYVLIIGARYGAVNSEGVSYTEREYDYAVETGKNIIGLIHGALDNIPSGKTEKDQDLAKKLEEFRQRVSTGRLVSFWTTSENLQLAFTKSFVHAMKRYPGVGWIRADAAASAEVLAELSKLKSANAELKIKAIEPKNEFSTDIKDLALGEEEYKITYYWSEYENKNLVRHTGSYKLTWDLIFYAVSYNLGVPKPAAQTGEFVGAMIRQSAKLDRSVKCYSGNIEVINNQLALLNLIRLYSQPNAKGDTIEYMELTPGGRARRMEILAVKRKPTEG